MAKFTDLVFKPHPNMPDATFANFEFPNGYSISVITGEFAYTSEKRPYEVAVMSGGSCCYDTPITDDVLGYQNVDDINETMALIGALPTP